MTGRREAMKTKLKNVETGEVTDVFLLTTDADNPPSLKGLAFSPEKNRWETVVVQRWSAAMAKAVTYWVPAVLGVDC